MTKFEECKSEWLKYAQEEKILITEIRKKMKIVLNQQKEIGKYFSFPQYNGTIEETITHHWFFHETTSRKVLECPCCGSNKISVINLKVEIDYVDAYECPSCGYFAIDQHLYIDSHSYLQYQISNHSLKIFNSLLDKHSNKSNEYFERTHR